MSIVGEIYKMNVSSGKKERLQAADVSDFLKRSLKSCSKVNTRKAEFCSCHNIHIHLSSKGSSVIYFFSQADVKYRLVELSTINPWVEILLPTNNLHSKRLHLSVVWCSYNFF
jgi:hypothetical protein